MDMKDLLKIENFKNANSVGVSLTWKELEELLATALGEREAEVRGEIIRQAKIVCLGAVTSLGYALKWEDYEIMKLSMILKKQILIPNIDKLQSGYESKRLLGKRKYGQKKLMKEIYEKNSI